MAGTRKPRKPRAPKKGGGTQSGSLTIPPRPATAAGSTANQSLVGGLAQQFTQASKEDTPNIAEILYRVAVEATRGEASGALAAYQQALGIIPAEKKTSLLKAADQLASQNTDEITPSQVFAQEVVPGRQDITNDLAARMIDTERARTQQGERLTQGRGTITSRESVPESAESITTRATPDAADAVAKLRRANKVFEEYQTKLEAALEGGMSQEQFDLTPAARRLQKRLSDAVEGDLDLLDYLDMRLDEQPAPDVGSVGRAMRGDFGTGLSPGGYGLERFEARKAADRQPEDAMYRMLGPWGRAAERINTLIPLLNERLAGTGIQLTLRPDGSPAIAEPRNPTISGIQPSTINALRDQIRNFRELPIDENVGRFDHVTETGVPINRWVWDNVLTPEARAEIQDITTTLRNEGALTDIGTDLFDDEAAPGKPRIIVPTVLDQLSPEVREELLVRQALEKPEFVEGGPTAFGSEADRANAIGFVQRQLDDALRRQSAAKAARAMPARQSNTRLAKRAELVNELLAQFNPELQRLALSRTSLSPVQPTQQIALNSKLDSLLSGLRSSGLQGEIPVAIPERIEMPGARGRTNVYQPQGSFPATGRVSMRVENSNIRRGAGSAYDSLLEDIRRLITPQADATSGSALDPNWANRTTFNLSQRIPSAFRRYGVYFNPYNPTRPFGGMAFGEQGLLTPEVFSTLMANNAALDPLQDADFRRAFIDFLTRQAQEQLPAGPGGVRAMQEYGSAPLKSGQYRQPTMISNPSMDVIRRFMRERGMTDLIKEFNAGVGQFQGDLDAGRYNPASPAYQPPAADSVSPYDVAPQPLDVPIAPPKATDSVDPYSMGYVRPDAMFVKPSFRIPLLRNLVA